MSITDRGILEAANANEGKILLSALTDRIKANLRAQLQEQIQPMVDAMIEEAVTAATKELRMKIAAQLDPMYNELVVMLRVNTGEPVRIDGRQCRHRTMPASSPDDPEVNAQCKDCGQVRSGTVWRSP